MSENKCLEMQCANGFNFEAKKKIVEAGNSRILKNWQEISAITKEEFLDALEWLCADKLNEHKKLTREVGLTPTGWVKLYRTYYADGDFKGFYDEDGKLWGGKIFRVPAKTEKERKFYADADGMIPQMAKISISPIDRI